MGLEMGEREELEWLDMYLRRHKRRLLAMVHRVDSMLKMVEKLKRARVRFFEEEIEEEVEEAEELRELEEELEILEREEF